MPSSLTSRSFDAPGDPWQRWPIESQRAFSAFEIFRMRGTSRTLSSVARELSVSRQLIQRWASKYAWHERVAAYDAAEARLLDMATVRTKAAIRNRQAIALENLQNQAIARLGTMNPAELSPMEVAAFLRTAANAIQDGDELERGDPRFANVPIPQFTIQVIRPGFATDGSCMIGVQIPGENGEPTQYGYIPESRMDEAQRDHPDWLFIR